jgi:hypothetical protein
MIAPQPPPGTPPLRAGAQRLMQSRLAILDCLRPPVDDPQPADRARGPSRWNLLYAAGRRYWQGHPARLAAALVAPLVSHWGRRHPLALVALSVAAGAVLVVARPWRVLSLTGLLAAALKSPHLASLAMSALAARRARGHPQGHDAGPR